MSVPRAAVPPGSLDLDAATQATNAWIEVDLGALAANVAALKGAFGPGVELMAVVKANAYGHGVAGVVPTLDTAGVDRLCVATMAEALALRAAGTDLPILVMGHSFPGDAAAAVEHDITLTVDCEGLGEALAAAGRASGYSVPVQVKVDTGLHRFGVEPERAVTLAEALRRMPGLEVEALWTHMANADEADDSFSDEQQAVFERVSERLWWIPFRHAANSATALRRPSMRYNGVRTGLGMYGIVPGNTPDPGVTPALSVKARLARVSDVSPGEGVSYGLEWRATRPSRVGLVPVGYGDGWRRALGNNSDVLVGGRRCPVVGRVCMDHFVIDVTDVPGAGTGDVAVLLGAQGSERITADELATAAGTISYDIVASLTARLPRFHHRSGVLA